MDPTMIIAALAGLFIMIGSAIKTYKERLQEQKQQQQIPQYAATGTGYVSTPYVQQAPPPTYVPPVQEYRPVVPAPQPVAPCPSANPWGYNAYIATIANTPVQQQYTTYYPNGVYEINGVKYGGKPCLYNVDYTTGAPLNQNNAVQGRAAPPGYTFGQPFSPTLNQAVQSQPYPWSASGTVPNVTVSPWSGTNTSQYVPQYSPQRFAYNTDYHRSDPVISPQSINTGTVRTYSDGSVSFCKIPTCYNDNGTYRF